MSKKLVFEAHFCAVSLVMMRLWPVRRLWRAEKSSSSSQRISLSAGSRGNLRSAARPSISGSHNRALIPVIACLVPTRIGRALERKIAQLPRSRRLLGWQITDALGLARSTAIKVLKRLGLARLRNLEPPRLTKRYDYDRAGRARSHRYQEARAFPWRRPSHPRRSQSAIALSRPRHRLSRRRRRQLTRNRLDSEDAACAVDFFRRLAAAYERRRVTIERVLTDNGKVFTLREFQDALAEIGAHHILSPPALRAIVKVDHCNVAAQGCRVNGLVRDAKAAVHAPVNRSGPVALREPASTGLRSGRP